MANVLLCISSLEYIFHLVMRISILLLSYSCIHIFIPSWKEKKIPFSPFQHKAVEYFPKENGSWKTIFFKIGLALSYFPRNFSSVVNRSVGIIVLTCLLLKQRLIPLFYFFLFFSPFLYHTSPLGIFPYRTSTPNSIFGNFIV